MVEVTSRAKIQQDLFEFGNSLIGKIDTMTLSKRDDASARKVYTSIENGSTLTVHFISVDGLGVADFKAWYQLDKYIENLQ